MADVFSHRAAVRVTALTTITKQNRILRMKTTWKLLAAGIVTASIGCLALAQSRGPGSLGAGWCCAVGAAQTNGWWAQVKPATAEQKEFVAKTAKLNEKIVAAQKALLELRTDQADSQAFAAKQKELNDLCADMRDLQMKNWNLKRQMLSGTARPGCGCQGGWCWAAQ